MLRLAAGFLVAMAVLPGSASLAETPAPAAKTQPASPPPPEQKNDKAAAQATQAPAPPPDVWSETEITAAKASCAAALKGLNAVITYEAPIKDGNCGTPAPIRLSKLDNVTFTPAALINCGMLVPMHTWISKDLQPLALRQLRSRITTIAVMSDYSCRSAFGRVGKKLSEHAYVDALDIRGFVTAKGEQVSVLEGWGSTSRDIAAAKAREEKIIQAAQAAAAKAKVDGTAPAASPSSVASAAPSVPGPKLLKPTRSDNLDVVTVILPGGIRRQQVASRLGGPRAAGADKKADGKDGMKSVALGPAVIGGGAMATSPASGPHAQFLRDAHAAACRIFGTTLGPEANEMHRNHFHVDNAERKVKKICD